MPTGGNTFDLMVNGEVPDATNTGGGNGDPISSIAVGTASTIVASNERPFHGPMGVRFSLAANTADGATRMFFPVAETARLVWSIHWQCDVVPTADEDIMGFRHAAGNMGWMGISGDSKFYIRDAAGAGIAGGVSKSTASVLADTKYRIDMSCAKGTTTTDGHLGYSVWSINPTTGAETLVHTWSSSAVNTGTADISYVLLGRSTGRAQANIMWYDSVRWETLASGFMSTYVVVNIPPQVILTTDAVDIEPGRVMQMSITASDSDGTVVTLTTAQVGGLPAVTLAGPTTSKTYTAPPTVSGTALTFQSTAIDDDAAETTSDPITHWILQSTELVVRAGALSPAYVQIGNTP